MHDHNLFNLFCDPDRPGTKNWLNTCYQLRRPGRWYYYNKMLSGFSEWSTEMANFSYSIKIMEILILTIIWKYICKSRSKYKLGNFQIPRDPFWSPYDITQSLHQVTMSVLRCDLVFANIQAPNFNIEAFFSGFERVFRQESRHVTWFLQILIIEPFFSGFERIFRQESRQDI